MKTEGQNITPEELAEKFIADYEALTGEKLGAVMVGTNTSQGYKTFAAQKVVLVRERDFLVKAANIQILDKLDVRLEGLNRTGNRIRVNGRDVLDALSITFTADFNDGDLWAVRISEIVDPRLTTANYLPASSESSSENSTPTAPTES